MLFFFAKSDPYLNCPNCVDESQINPNRWTMPLLKLGEKRYYLGIFFKVNMFCYQNLMVTS
ncbi:CLUMA_CG009106, isoform A [Clunio marinus]|uniref:CLUMA_CG009106, isoform A n=1 Tax=Clunio marinus TaxID=568069 RepID=A0A1J1I5V1_9DIPT|nr:CLUMA_CG009106, isoform A [Clunio marinus]